MKPYIYSLILLVILTAYESREDVFRHRNVAPSIRVSTTNDLVEASNHLALQLKFGERVPVYFEVHDDNMPEDYALDAAITGKVVEAAVLDGTTIRKLCNDMQVSVVNNQLVIHSLTDAKFRCPATVHYTIYLSVRDVYDVEAQAVIELDVTENHAPSVQVEATYVGFTDTYNGHVYDQGYTYRFQLLEVGDRDGDEVVAYEYAFDPQGLTPGSLQPNYVIQAAEGAFGGTYIHATTLSSVYHVFQSQGDHTFYVRAQDAVGMWSAWQRYTVEVR